MVNDASTPVESRKGKVVEFPAKIIITKKGHWYVTIPTIAKKMIEDKKAFVKVTLEKIL